MSAELERIWVFDESKLDQAIDNYRQAALSAFPNQQERINITMMAVKDFLNSEHAKKLTMNVKVSDKQKNTE